MILLANQDYRLPINRREVFKRFYYFHNKHKAHPGFVYAAFPYLANRFAWSKERLLWACFLNGVCQNIVTTETLLRYFPDLPTKNEADQLHSFVMRHWHKLEWDMDRKYTKSKIGDIVLSYLTNLDGQTQSKFFESVCGTDGDNYIRFRRLWNYVMEKFFLFGRLSTFSYLEYLRIAGLPIDCDSLFLDDINGSKSHRNGLCKILGRDDLDWHETLNPGFNGDYSKVLPWLEQEGERLLKECSEQYPHPDNSYFTLESTMCCYKSWFRKDRRYPGVYLDMHYKRIQKAEERWGFRFDNQRELRKDTLPIYLRVEDNPSDPTHKQTGLSKEKQNHFRLTGEVIMMDQDFPVFENSFNSKYYHNVNELVFE